MKKLQKSIKAIAAAMLMCGTFSLTSCDVMFDMMSGMAAGMTYYNPYGNTSSFGGYTNNNYLLDPNYAMWQVQNGIYSGGTSSTNSTSSSSTSTSSTTSKTHKCGLCGGTGRITETKGVPSFGNTKYCNECGKTVADNHYHTKCISCDGKGWW